MFDQSYRFNLIGHEVEPEMYVHERWMYNFTTERRRYVCLVERYARNIYIVKYYPASHARSKSKYQVIVNDDKPARIVGTCIQIMLHHYRQDPTASFGFLATNSINKKGKVEAKANNQRYRIYKYAVESNFGSKTFAHSRSAKQSAYLMINRVHKRIRVFRSLAEAMFSKIYPSLQ